MYNPLEYDLVSLERRQRELRAGIAAADRAGDQELLTKLMTEKLQADRARRECSNGWDEGRGISAYGVCPRRRADARGFERGAPRHRPRRR